MADSDIKQFKIKDWLISLLTCPHAGSPTKFKAEGEKIKYAVKIYIRKIERHRGQLSHGIYSC